MVSVKPQIANILGFVGQESKKRIFFGYLYNKRENKFLFKIQNIIRIEFLSYRSINEKN